METVAERGARLRTSLARERVDQEQERTPDPGAECHQRGHVAKEDP